MKVEIAFLYLFPRNSTFSWSHGDQNFSASATKRSPFVVHQRLKVRKGKAWNSLRENSSSNQICSTSPFPNIRANRHPIIPLALLSYAPKPTLKQYHFTSLLSTQLQVFAGSSASGANAFSVISLVLSIRHVHTAAALPVSPKFSAFGIGEKNTSPETASRN